MSDWSYPRVEGILRGLAQAPQARPAQVSVRMTPVRTVGPRTSFPESTSRLDVSIGLERLEPEHQIVLREHYVLGIRRHGSGERRRAIRRLKTLLDGD